MKERILSFMREVNPYEEIDCNTPLFDNGILDSLGMAELLVFIQEEFQIDIAETMINEENFQTVETIVETIEKNLKF